MLTRCIPHKADVSYGAVTFSLYGPETREWLNLEREISLYNDGGPWRFHIRGTELPFEEPYHYSERKVADRFTPEMLERYCAAVGVRLLNDDFYLPSQYLITRARRYASSRSISLADRRAELGLEP